MVNKKRLIDANALADKLKAHHDFFVNAWGGFSNLPIKDKARVDEITSCIAEIINAPTVDAVEVVRGRWIGVDPSYWRWKHDGGHMVEHITYRCSECARKSITKTNYCPNCGAKMYGDGNGN